MGKMSEIDIMIKEGLTYDEAVKRLQNPKDFGKKQTFVKQIKPKTTNHIVIEVDDEKQAYKLFEEIQNKYSLYDNCVIEIETPIEDTIVDDDRWEENGGYLKRGEE